MVEPKVTVKPKESGTFYLRKLTKSGASRYLSVGTILPVTWIAVKVFVIKQEEDTCILRLEQIK